MIQLLLQLLVWRQRGKRRKATAGCVLSINTKEVETCSSQERRSEEPCSCTQDLLFVHRPAVCTSSLSLSLKTSCGFFNPKPFSSYSTHVNRCVGSDEQPPSPQSNSFDPIACAGRWEKSTSELHLVSRPWQTGRCFPAFPCRLFSQERFLVHVFGCSELGVRLSG